MTFVSNQEGQVGLNRYRSTEVLPLPDCLIADQQIIDSGVLTRESLPNRQLQVAASRDEVTVTARPRRNGRVRTKHPHPAPQTAAASRVVLEQVSTARGTWSYQVAADGFWQPHRGAPAAYVENILELLDPQPGDSVLDLYSGVGLFAVPLAQFVGRTGRVLAVEGDRRASALARSATAKLPWVRVRTAPVRELVAQMLRQSDQVDAIVLDPPRVGARREVMAAVAGLARRRIAYVACDPASLARDASYLLELGWKLEELRAFDAFPMSHHVECIATFIR